MSSTKKDKGLLFLYKLLCQLSIKHVHALLFIPNKNPNFNYKDETTARNTQKPSIINISNTLGGHGQGNFSTVTSFALIDFNSSRQIGCIHNVSMRTVYSWDFLIDVLVEHYWITLGYHYAVSSHSLTI